MNTCQRCDRVVMWDDGQSAWVDAYGNALCQKSMGLHVVKENE